MKKDIREGLSLTKIVDEDIEVELEIMPFSSRTIKNEKQTSFEKELDWINAEIEEKQLLIDDLNDDIDLLTSHVDKIDYIVAGCCGVLTGMIDVFFVGEFSLTNNKDWGSKKVNSFVEKFARINGYKGKEGDSIGGPISFLEQKFKMASDSVTNTMGGSRQHHLRDFSHHPTPLGCVFSLFTQFSKKVVGTNTAGKLIIESLPDDALIGKSIEEKILLGIVNWFGHLISDIAGSSNTPGGGMGLPGPLLSILKNFSAVLHPLIPQNNSGNNKLSVWIAKLYNGTLLADRDSNGKIIRPQNFDFRAELGLLKHIGKQSIPVLINETIVYVFYVTRQLTAEIKRNSFSSLKDLNNIEWHKVLNYKSRTIKRMLTISMGSFMAVDLADAAICSMVKSKGNSAAFFSNFLLKVNFVGTMRFTFATYTDAKMGYKKERKRDERIRLYQELLELNNAKCFYKQGLVWVAANSAEKMVDEVESEAIRSIQCLGESWDDITDSIVDMGSKRFSIESCNPGLLDEISSLLD